MNVLVASHPRSGTNWTLNTITLNFGYPRYIPLPENPEEIQIMTQHSLFKTHFAYYKLVGTDAMKCKLIYVSREIKDTLASMYHCDMTEYGTEPYCISFQEWLWTKPTKKWGIDSENKAEVVVKHRESWKKVEGCLFITYEDLFTKFEPTCRKIWSHIGNEEELPLSIKSGGEWIRPLKSDCIRPYKGIIGAWKDVFTPEDLAFIKPYDTL